MGKALDVLGWTAAVLGAIGVLYLTYLVLDHLLAGPAWDYVRRGFTRG